MSLWNKIFTFGRVEMAGHFPLALMAYMLGILVCSFLKINGIILFFLIIINGFLLLILRHRLVLFCVTLFSFFFFLGWGNICFHINVNQHPVLTHSLYQTPIVATVLENQSLLDRQILVLGQIHWQNPDLNMPRKIKVHYKKKDPFLQIGDTVKAVVSVYPPNKDFSPTYAQQLWFNQIGATGIVTSLEMVSSKANSSIFFNIRTFINRYLFQILPLSQAEIVAPLITGEQKLISSQTYQIYRRAGIAHVLSVSGFHMALLATFLFFMIRHFCAFFPRIALYYNTKKIAAVVALMGTFLYLGVSGFQIPAIRAFVMIALVFLGVLIERAVLSMHSLMLVAMGILLVLPQMIFSISFQLSFMAVMVLVFICQYLNEQPWNRFIKIMVGFIALNIVVFFATMPFILYHFHQWLPYGIFGNMVFNWAFSFFIMPLLFIGTLLIPFGIDVPFFRVAGWGLDIVNLWAEKLAYLPNAEVQINHFSVFALGLIGFGTMMICLMKTSLRWLGCLLILAGIAWGIWT